MLYNIVINQKSIVENGFSIKANHIAVLESISNFILSNKAVKITDQTGDWYWVSYELIISQIPMFGISKHRCRQLISELCDDELLERHPENEKLARVYLRLGRKFDLYKNFDPANNLNEGVKKLAPPCQKISTPPAKKLAPPCQKISRDNNTNNNSTNNNSTKDNSIGASAKNDFSSNQDFDSFIPKSENKKNKVSPAPRKFSKADFVKSLIELGANEQFVEDWCKARESKKAAYTRTALDAFINECSLNNFPIDEAVRLCAENGWRGFKVEWVKNLQNNGAKQITRVHATERQLDAGKKALDRISEMFKPK